MKLKMTRNEKWIVVGSYAIASLFAGFFLLLLNSGVLVPGSEIEFLLMSGFIFPAIVGTLLIASSGEKKDV